MDFRDINSPRDLVKYAWSHTSEIIFIIVLALAVFTIARGLFVPNPPLPDGFTKEDFQ